MALGTMAEPPSLSSLMLLALPYILMPNGYMGKCRGKEAASKVAQLCHDGRGKTSILELADTTRIMEIRLSTNNAGETT